MTVTAPPQQARTPRRLRAVMAVLVAVGVFALGTLGAPAVARAEAATPSPSPTLSGEITVDVAPIGNGIIRPTGGLTVWVAAANGRRSVLPATTVSIALGRTPLSDRDALATWLAGDTTGVAVEPIGTGTLDAVGSGADATTTVTIPGEAAELAGRGPGVYPLLASVPGPDHTRSATSVVVVRDDAAPRAPVAVVVPITAGARGSGVVPADALTALTAPEGDLTAMLDAVSGTSAILAIDPAVVASIRVLGTAAPPSATLWLARLEALPNARFALQYGDADVSAQLAGGNATLLQPTSLAGYMDPAAFTSPAIPEPGPTSSGTPSPTSSLPSPTPTSSPTPSPTTNMPTLSELVDVGADYPTVYWPPTGTANATVVHALGVAGAETVPPMTPVTLIASTSLTAGASGAALPTHASADGADLLVYDAAASAALRDAAAASDTVTRGAALAAASAELAMASAATQAAPTLVVVDRPAEITRSGLRAAILTADQGGAVAVGTLDAAAAVPAADATVTDSDASVRRSQVLPGFEADEAEIAAFSTILDDPSLLTGRQRAEILHVLGAAWLPTPEAWDAAVASHHAGTAATLGAVSILPPSPLNLLASDADLRFWIRNDLPWPVTVVLSTRPDNLRLEVEPTTSVDHAQPLSNTRAQVPVQAKVGNGEVTLRLSLHSTTGVPIGNLQEATVNVRADWERIGLVILGGLVVGLLVVGAVRTVRRRRRARLAEHP